MKRRNPVCVHVCMLERVCLLGEGRQLLPLRVGGDKKLPAVTLCHNQLSQIIPGKTICKGAKGA